MQIQKQNGENSASSKAGRPLMPGTNRPGKNGSEQTGTYGDACTGVRFHFLEKDLKPKSLFELSMFTDNDKNKGLFKIVDTEEKQLQAIQDLYSIVKAQPKYKNLKDPEWKETDSPITVLYWVLKKLGPLAGGYKWTVDTYKIGRKTRFRFVVYRYYHSQRVSDRELCVPLDYLPALKKRDQPLHDMIIDTVALVSRENKVPLWDEDGDFSQALSVIKDYPTSPGYTQQNFVLHQQKISYTTGPAHEYLTLIKKRRRLIHSGMIVDQLAKYDDSSGRKQVMVWWIKKGLRLASSKQNISGNSYVPNYITGNPITPFRLYKFIWSLHDNDFLKAKAFGRMTKDQKQYDIFLPIEFNIAHPGQIVKPVPRDTFPEELFSFLFDGISITLSRYKDYYYKNQLESQKTPSEHLLEQIENAEIKRLSNE